MMGTDFLITDIYALGVMLIISIILGHIAQKTKYLRIGDD